MALMHSFLRQHHGDMDPVKTVMYGPSASNQVCVLFLCDAAFFYHQSTWILTLNVCRNVLPFFLVIKNWNSIRTWWNSKSTKFLELYTLIRELLKLPCLKLVLSWKSIQKSIKIDFVRWAVSIYDCVCCATLLSLGMSNICTLLEP